MEGQVKIMHAKMTDVKSIIQLQAQLDRHLPKDKHEIRKFQELVRDYIRLKDSRGIILATSNSKIVGMISYVLYFSYVLIDRLNQPLRELWIPELVVNTGYRNRGIGKRLVMKCESIARRNKCYRIRLESRNDRTDSHNFYKKIGFSQMALAFDKKLI
ncbi:MAG: GNAT family N-acetyltransferase [Nitrososphaeraceae archaeon]